jgi:acyl-CoA dehydrogenase
MQPFNQPPPELGNQYHEDRVLRAYLRRKLPPEILAEVEPILAELGELSGGELYRLQLADRLNEPHLIQWDAWGERIDRIELSPLWQQAERLAARYGIVAAAYDSPYGWYARPVQFALAYLFHPSTDVYSCPLAMSDGAARTLLISGRRDLIERAVPRLTSRDPEQVWTSGQWMTESTGGSDVGTSETIAIQENKDNWRLYGRKYFTSATTSQMALTLARPEGNGPGGRGLALFYLEIRDEDGKPNGILVNRLKEKLGTRKVPTAEVTLDGALATPVMGTTNGVRNIVPMLHLTRTWNSVSAVAFMRRGLALARDYAGKRTAFSARLSEKPLHLDTLAGLQAEMEAAFYLTFYLVELIGKQEAGESTPDEAALVRLVTSLVKLTTGRQAVEVASEVVEAMGGAGYIEDTGLPILVRDSQVLPIWEGTTNVLALEALRALPDGDPLTALAGKIEACAQDIRASELAELVVTAKAALLHALQWLELARSAGLPYLEAGARRFGLTLGRALALALLAEQAQWSLDHEADPRPMAAARRFALQGIDRIGQFAPSELDLRESALLGTDRLPEALSESGAQATPESG